MLVSYTELCKFVEDGVIVGSDLKDVNGTSIDVYLGPMILAERAADREQVVSLLDKQQLKTNKVDITDRHYDLRPGEFVLAHTIETFNLPANISAEFKLNSSGARIGLENALATWCLVGETEIATLDGGTVQIQDLAVSDGAWVYAVSSDGKLVPAKATASRITKEVTETIRVTLDNGAFFECTPDHKVLMRDNTFIEAEKLTSGVALMPLNRRINAEGREEVYAFNPGKSGVHSGKWTPTHRFGNQTVLGGIPEGYCVHHKDLGVSDNRPDNLEVLSTQDHIGLHAKVRNKRDEKAISTRASARNKKMWSDAEWAARKNAVSAKQMSTLNAKQWADPEHRKAMLPIQRETAAKNFAKVPREEVTLACKVGCVKKTIRAIMDARETVGEETYVKFKRQNWPTVKTLTVAFGSFSNALSAAGYQNHKVLSVERISHANPVPVYDLTVPEHHNFGLACGAFVHNCDPLWNGSVLTLELKNLTQWHTIRLHHGCRIGQMIFHKSVAVPHDKSYAVRGRYNGDVSVSGVKGATP